MAHVLSPVFQKQWLARTVGNDDDGADRSIALLYGLILTAQGEDELLRLQGTRPGEARFLR